MLFTMKKLAVLLLIIGSVFAGLEENRGIEDPNLFEGDIKLTEDQRTELNTRGERASIWYSLWPGAQVAYDVEPSIANHSFAMALLKDAIDEFHQKTCIRFKKRKTENDYLSVYIGSGCWSHVGWSGGKQRLSLGVSCWQKGIIIHELAHALGFFHEQSRPDRDKYVEIKYENIIQGTEINFMKYGWEIDSLGTPYDYESVMHYGSKDFSKNGQPTIVPKKQGVFIGQRRGLSRIDAIQMKLLYRCKNGKPMPPPTLPPVPQVFNCDFESNCGFIQRKDDKFDWTRRHYATSSMQTGPSGDHTTGKGYYMYIEASHLAKGDNAIIEKTVTIGSNQCLTFYYHMYGFHIGTLNVFVGSSKVFTKSGPQGNKWVKASVRLSQTGAQKISFEGIRANGYAGDIAIDDISIGYCG